MPITPKVRYIPLADVSPSEDILRFQLFQLQTQLGIIYANLFRFLMLREPRNLLVIVLLIPMALAFYASLV